MDKTTPVRKPCLQIPTKPDCSCFSCAEWERLLCKVAGVPVCEHDETPGPTGTVGPVEVIEIEQPERSFEGYRLIVRMRVASIKDVGQVLSALDRFERRVFTVERIETHEDGGYVWLTPVGSDGVRAVDATTARAVLRSRALLTERLR